ncbi:Fc.00g083630.m01.CDS01 [Cosmosporella sp. VM-42]
MDWTKFGDYGLGIATTERSGSVYLLPSDLCQQLPPMVAPYCMLNEPSLIQDIVDDLEENHPTRSPLPERERRAVMRSLARRAAMNRAVDRKGVVALSLSYDAEDREAAMITPKKRRCKKMEDQTTPLSNWGSWLCWPSSWLSSPSSSSSSEQETSADETTALLSSPETSNFNPYPKHHMEYKARPTSESPEDVLGATKTGASCKGN